MVQARSIAVNARARVPSPPNVMNVKERGNSPPRKELWNVTFATAAASYPSNAPNASVAADKSVKHVTEPGAKKAT